jgi:L-malate glycosyltransferase
MRNIHQFVAGYSHHDAISNETRVLRGLFESWGAESRVYSEPRRILPELRGEARDAALAAAEVGPEDIAFLHLSIGSDVNDLFPLLPCRKVILYHNITPPDYFHGLQEQIAANLARGREQMKRLAGVADVVMADSDYNAAELRDLGYGEVAVLPLVLDLKSLRGKPHRRILRQLDDGLVNILFVGRCVPNKRIEDCLNAFYFFQKTVCSNARFIHVGSYAGTEQYHALLLTRLRDLGLEHVDLVGSVRQNELNAYYDAADVFLCMSEHEGFCIPVMEAMVHRVPVLAYAAAAVPETMAGAGVLVREKSFDRIAEMMGRLAEPGPLRDAVIAAQDRRIAAYERRDLATELKALLSSLLSPV